MGNVCQGNRPLTLLEAGGSPHIQEDAVEYRPYDRLEQQILSSDTGAIRLRWKWGRLVVCDPDLAHPDGRLRAGTIDDLIDKAAAKGTKLSRSEIKYRVQLARTYPTEPQIGQLVGQFGTWKEIIQAGFPAVEAPEDAEPYDPRTIHKKRNDAETQINRIMDSPEAHGQQTLPLPGMRIFLPGFTPDTIGRETLFREAFKIHRYIRDELTPQLRKAANQAEREDRERESKLNQMFDAAGRDLDRSLGEAEDILLGPVSE